MTFFLKLKTFLHHPYSVIGCEALLSSIELTWGLQLFFSKAGLWDIMALQIFYNSISSSIIAIPWLLAGSFSLSGLYLSFKEDDFLCRGIILRRVGATLSFCIWPWMLASSLFNTGPASPALAVYFWFWVTSFKILWLSWATRCPTK